MCELLAMSCRYPARLTFSLGALASRARLPSKNQDGWGVAYYQARDVALYRDTASADGHPLVDWLMANGPATKTVLGYIRHGTQGDITLANTAPFIRELNGRVHTFIHNGNLRCADTRRASSDSRFQPIGDTDSELAFCQLLAQIASLPHKPGKQASLDARMAAIAALARQFRACGPSNFIYGDGDALFVHADQRYQAAAGKIAPPALHFFECYANKIPGLVCEVESPYPVDDQRVILLATVPLSDHPWQPLDRGQLLALRDGEVAARVTI